MKATLATAFVIALAPMCVAQSTREHVSSAEIQAGSNAVLATQNFLRIKQFILTKGDRQTYCNKYNNNPHYGFSTMDIYLNPDTGQQNINCDLKLSDFNGMIVRTRDFTYYSVNMAVKTKLSLLLRQYHSDEPAKILEAKVEECFRNALSEIEHNEQSNRLGTDNDK